MLRRDWLKGLCAAVGGMAAAKAVVAAEPVVATVSPVAVAPLTTGVVVRGIHDSVVVSRPIDFRRLEDRLLRCHGIDSKFLRDVEGDDKYEQELLTRMHGPVSTGKSPMVVPLQFWPVHLPGGSLG